MIQYLLIGVGGGLGAIARHLVSRASLRWFGPDQPWGTLAVNVIGGLAMGLLIGWLLSAERADQTQIRLFAAVGFLGGFTTFSAFSLELGLMVERKLYLNAFAYGAASVILALGALMLGLMITRRAFA